MLAGVVGAAAAVVAGRVRAGALTRQVSQELAEQREASVRASVDTLVAVAREELGAHTAAGTRELEVRNELMDQRVDALHRQLDQLGGLVRDLEQDRRERFGALTEQLAHTSRGTAELARTTQALQAALGSHQARGQWGERMAEDVLRAAGFVEGVNYRRQAASRNGRPDFTFLLPGERAVHMDVKFPLDNYLRAVEAEDEAHRKRHTRAFLRDVRARIQELATRDYLDAEAGTLGQVLLFIPNEQVYAFVHQHDHALLDDALAQRVVLCSPLTLFAVLAVIRDTVDQVALDPRRDELRRRLAAVEREGRTVVTSLGKLGTRLDGVRREADTVAACLGRFDEELQRLAMVRSRAQDPAEVGDPSSGAQRPDAAGRQPVIAPSRHRP